MLTKSDTVEHLIIGGGIAGLKLALHLAQSGKVLIITKSTTIDNNSWHAQGGIASVQDPEDSFAQHMADTLDAGAGLCHSNVVHRVVEGGPKAIKALVEWGAQFSRNAEDGSYHLTKEGGHGARRVVHAADLTGREVMRALLLAVQQHPQIELRPEQFVMDLLCDPAGRCLGAMVLEKKSHRSYPIQAQRTYLCTGGCGKTYLYTSNPDSATGDGIALARRAGCRIANLEFMQFHPTCLYHPLAKNFLLSEALRGEGAILRNKDGDDFTSHYHPKGSLAPRDIVARAIDSELKKSGEDYVLLDATAIGEKHLKEHFCSIHNRLTQLGFRLEHQPIPVVPAAHYSCGGVVVDSHGRTDRENLYALGEVAFTGLHGANRLASNSLLEALVYADLVAEHSLGRPFSPLPATDLDPRFTQLMANPLFEDNIVLTHTWGEIRRIMWDFVGIVRNNHRLQRALTKITSLHQEWHDQAVPLAPSTRILEVRNLMETAYLTIQSARGRKESRGIHYNSDYPEKSPEYASDSIL